MCPVPQPSHAGLVAAAILGAQFVLPPDAASRRRGDAATLVNVDFGGQGKGSTDGEVFYETPTGLLKTAFPAFLDGTAGPAQRRAGRGRSPGRAGPARRRTPISSRGPWSTASGRTSSAMASRGPSMTWARPAAARIPSCSIAWPTNSPPAHYDLKSVIRWVALSDRLRPLQQDRLAPQQGHARGGRSGPLQPLLHAANAGPKRSTTRSCRPLAFARRPPTSGDIEKARVDWLAQFNRPMGTDDADEESHFSGGMRPVADHDERRPDAPRRQQRARGALGQRHRQQAQIRGEGRAPLPLGPLPRSDPPRGRSRPHDPRQQRRQEAIALEDIWWALLNSNEFILDH